MSIVADVIASSFFFWLAKADISVGRPQPFNILSLVRLCFDDSVMSHLQPAQIWVRFLLASNHHHGINTVYHISYCIIMV